MKKRFFAIMLVAFAVLTGGGVQAQAPWTAMVQPAQMHWQTADAQEEYILLDGGETPVYKKAKKDAAKHYTWKQYALRVTGTQGAYTQVALPGGEVGYVRTNKTRPAQEQERPSWAVDTSTAYLGYVYVAAKGELPIVCEIEKDGEVHALLVPNNGKWQAVLLSLGDGAYRLSIYEAGYLDERVRRMDDTRFIIGDLPTDTELALYSNLHTNLEDHPLTIALAHELTTDAMTDREKVEALWGYLMENAQYDTELARTIQYSEMPDGDCFVRGEKGICCDYAAFLACALRELGVPCKHVYGINKKSGNQHAWNEIYLEGEWLLVDATLSRKDKDKHFHTEDPSGYRDDPRFWSGWH